MSGHTHGPSTGPPTVQLCETVLLTMRDEYGVQQLTPQYFGLLLTLFRANGDAELYRSAFYLVPIVDIFMNDEAIRYGAMQLANFLNRAMKPATENPDDSEGEHGMQNELGRNIPEPAVG